MKNETRPHVNSSADMNESTETRNSPDRQVFKNSQKRPSMITRQSTPANQQNANSAKGVQGRGPSLGRGSAMSSRRKMKEAIKLAVIVHWFLVTVLTPVLTFS